MGCPASNPACLGISGHGYSKEYKDYVAKAKRDQAALRAYLLRKTDAFKPIADVGLGFLPGLPPRKDVPAMRSRVGTNGPRIGASPSSQSPAAQGSNSATQGANISITADQAANGLDTMSAGLDIGEAIQGIDDIKLPSSGGMFLAVYAQELKDQDLGLTYAQHVGRDGIAAAEDYFVSSASMAVGMIYGAGLSPLSPALFPVGVVGGYVTTSVMLSQTMEQKVEPFLYNWWGLYPQ